MRLLYISLCLLACCATQISGARILGMFPFHGKSHWNFFKPLMLALAERGHEVTVVGHYPQVPLKPGYTDISIAGTFPNIVNSMTIDSILSDGKLRIITMQWDTNGYEICDVLYNNSKIKDLAISKEKYDVVITELFGADCFQPFAYKFQVPHIGITSSIILPFSADLINLPENPSYIPSYVVPFNSNMNFFERAFNAVTLVGFKLGYHFVSRRNTEQIARRLFPDMPPLLEISNNISLIISNTHFSLNGAKPGVPALVEAGGMHITEPKALPKSLSDILDKAEHGVVYFSFGSLIRSETLPHEKLKAFISAFGSLKQTVLWKLDGKVPENLPKNIIVKPWLPQLDVLCHKNVKVFITHGGLLGTQEAAYCGVPMIGIPFFADQDHNIKNYQMQGFALYLDLHNISETSMKYALNEILENSKYKTNAEEVSRRFKDRPRKPLDEAVYWTEYVIRHKGAPHLQTSARNLNWFQYFLLDVAAAICLIIVIIAFIIKKLLIAIKHIFFQKSRNKIKTK